MPATAAETAGVRTLLLLGIALACAPALSALEMVRVLPAGEAVMVERRIGWADPALLILLLAVLAIGVVLALLAARGTRRPERVRRTVRTR